VSHHVDFDTRGSQIQVSGKPATVRRMTVAAPPILVSTMNDLPGYEVVGVYGEVFGLVVRSRNMFSNIGASFRTIFGGEAKGYTDLLSTTRLEAVDRLRGEARALGANAILAMRFDTGVFASVMNEVAAYGTAVVVRPLPTTEPPAAS
jgi:uncharacterized protein YbjQ (UPF0145 family)